MQNIVRWHSYWLSGAVVRSLLGTPLSNKSDANPPEGDNPRNLLFVSRIVIPKMKMKIWIQRLLYPKSKSSVNENVKNFKYQIQLNVTMIWLSQNYACDKFNVWWLQ